uniref:Cytochrome P450 89A2 n=1 Tax=Fagus sylvatica TaxID=28930 RepID=A0A2N9GD48_FAGSY
METCSLLDPSPYLASASSFYFSASPGRWSPFSANTTPSTDPSSPSASASIPTSFIANHTLAHKSLVQNGAIFANRPPALLIDKIISRNQHNISTAFYGPTWRLLRRNLISEILHPSRVKSYSRARKWVLDILLNRLLSQSESGDPVIVKDHLQYSMFCLLVLMCFGDKLGETQIKEIEDVPPSLTFALEPEAVLMPLIEARRKVKQERLSKAKEDKDDDDEFVVSYVDTLLDLELPEEKRKLQEGEMVTLCSEFLNGGTDTTSTTLQWIMANLVKYPHIQEKLFVEIKGVVGDRENEVKEEDLNKMPYLKAVVLEGLRKAPTCAFGGHMRSQSPENVEESWSSTPPNGPRRVVQRSTASSVTEKRSAAAPTAANDEGSDEEDEARLKRLGNLPWPPKSVPPEADNDEKPTGYFLCPRGLEKSVMATTTRGQRPPQPSTPVVLAPPHHGTQEARFGGRGTNLLQFGLICRNRNGIDLLGRNAKNVPKNAVLIFMVAEMGWDPKVWEDPMAFQPERFLSGGGDGEGEVFDITGSREIKMMPFGAGRRICPAHGLAMLHLEYFIANLIWKFEWRAVDGDEVDLSEKQEFIIAMKYPLKAHLSRRI